MRVLLDEQLPRKLGAFLVGHDVSSVQSNGWSGLKNGALLAAAADAGFDVLMTADRNLSFQQDLANAKLGVVVLQAKSIDLSDLRPLIAEAISAISTVRAGEVIHVR